VVSISKGIFDEFYRASNARVVERDGTGLGLSIARQIVQRHGGQIWAQSRLGQGTTVSFTLLKLQGVEEQNKPNNIKLKSRL
jgi:histidine kinase